MRISEEIQNFFKENIKNILPNADIYLFGSRVSDTKKGGDIDILVLAGRTLSLDEKINIKTDFCLKFGEQQIDITSFTFDDDSTSKKIAFLKGIKL